MAATAAKAAAVTALAAAVDAEAESEAAARGERALQDRFVELKEAAAADAALAAKLEGSLAAAQTAAG